MDLSNINKKMLKYIIIIVVVFVAFLVILGVVKLVIGTKLSYQKIEDKMKSAAMSYIKDDKADVALPEGDEILTISVDDLVSNKKMKDLSKYIKDDDVSCSGNVVVRKQDDDYMYIPYLDCGEAYTTQTLSDYIVNNVEQVNAGDGLYFMNNEYVYRGEYVDNYVKFANQVWRIVKIDANGNIKLLQDTATKNKNSWDNRYNVDFKSTVGINDYSLSRVILKLEEIYNSTFNVDEQKLIATKNLCVGKRYKGDTSKDSSTECAEIIENQKIGLLQINEFLLASIDENCKVIGDGACQNYNYLAKYPNAWWTITANAANTAEVYQIKGGSSREVNANKVLNLKPIIYLNNDVIYSSGDGTVDNPYIFK